MPSIAFDAAVEFDSPDYSFDGELVRAYGTQAAEDDQAFAGTLHLYLAGTAATEQDIAAAGAVYLAVVGAQATEQDIAAAGSLEEPGTVFGAQAHEADSAAAGAVYITEVHGGTATETDLAFAGSATTGIIDDTAPPGERVTIRAGYRVTARTGTGTRVTVGV